MAVVQISKIQVRRGLKNSGIGVPQLSSAEFAWAVDTQELYIGNGSVLEGAPFVGNTKIITERDNILELAAGYQFANNDPAISFSVSRTLQSKVDEYVSVLDFGAVGDGITDNVEAFQTAFTQLFRNADSKFKKILFVPNGVYKFSSNLRIPGTANIQGESNYETILRFDNSNILLITEDGTDVSSFTSSDRPTQLRIAELNFRMTTGTFDITGLNNSTFDKVIFESNYVPTSPVESLDLRPALVSWSNTLIGTSVTGVSFRDCLFRTAKLAVRCTQTDDFETEIKFSGCQFLSTDVGIYIKGILDQVNRWVVERCDFDEQYHHAVYVTNGTGFIIRNSDFRDCGNGLNGPANPLYSIVYFGQTNDNVILNVTSDRHQNSAIISIDTVPAVTEFENVSKAMLATRNFAELFLSDGFRPLAVFPAKNRYIYLDYAVTIGEQNRHGRLIMTIDANKSNVSFTDDYSYSALFTTSPGGPTMINFDFTAILKDNDSDSGIETVVLYYKNPLLTGSSGTMSYSITYGV
jgi:hypothetical protein